MGVAALILGAIGLTVGLSNLINGIVNGVHAKEAAQEIKDAIHQLNLDIEDYIKWARNELRNILAAERAIQAGLKEVLAAINWAEVVIQIAQPVERVTFLFEEMLRFDSFSDEERKSWEKAALSEDIGGLKFSLSAIHDAVVGGTVLATPPLLQVFAEKVKAAPALRTSVRYLVMCYLRSLIVQQSHGYTALLNALVLNGSVEEQVQVIAQMKSRFQVQQEIFIKVVMSTSNEYSVDDMNDNWARSSGDAIFILGQVEAPPGMCIVGLKFQDDDYAIPGKNVSTNVHGIFPFIAVTPIEPLIFGEAPQITWIRFPNFATPADFQAGHVSGVGHLDLTNMETPSGTIATGIGLRVVDGKRLSLSVRPTAVTDAGLAPAGWVSNDNADNVSGSMSSQRFYVDTNEVVPHPIWPLSGFALYQKNNRIALKVSPGSPGLINSLFESWSKQKFRIRVEGSLLNIAVFPERMRIPAGAAVSWFNDNAGTLYVTVGDRQTDYFYKNDDSTPLKFDKPGEYEYTVTSDYVFGATGTVVVV